MDAARKKLTHQYPSATGAINQKLPKARVNVVRESARGFSI
jgi:hypothetical protein